MTNWKKQWNKKVIDELWNKTTTVRTQRLSITQEEIILDFISKEIIEKLIEDAEKIVKVHESPHTLGNCDLCQVQQLKDKWLNN